MKLRLKYNGRRIPLELVEEADNPPTLQKLRDNVVGLFPDIEPEFELSMNGKDTLESNPETLLSDLEIVSGDLIVVKTKQQQQQQQQQPQQQWQLQPPQPQQEPSSSQNVEMKDPDTATTSQDNNTEGTGTDDIPMVDYQPEEDPEAIKDELVNRYLREPLVVSESTAEELPEALHKLYTTVSPSSKTEALFLVLHVLMEETGFSLETDVPPYCLPPDWKSRGSFSLKYRHNSNTDATFRMIAIEMGPIIVVHAHGFPDGREGSQHQCQTKIKITDYVTQVAAEPHHSYQHLALLSRTFKDAVAHKILAVTCEGTNFVLTLTALLPEIQLQILQHLQAPDLVRVSATCKLLQARCNTPCIWRRRYLLDFGRRSNSDVNQDWKTFYKEKKIERQRMRRQMQRLLRPELPPWVNPPQPPLPLGPIYPPGGIGGDYDRDPFYPGAPGGVFPGGPRPRFDPFLGPGVPPHQFRPGRGGGINDRLPGLGGLNPGGRRSGGGGGFGPRFF